MTNKHEPVRALELFCGIGGFAEAAGGRAHVVGAIDQSEIALSVYRLNRLETPAKGLNLETVSSAVLAEFKADMWWLSPPCQPYTVRGKRRDLADPRAGSLRNLLGILPGIRPFSLGLENVEGFASSEARVLLVSVLEQCGYRFREIRVCPTELGIPNRRPRYYLFASLGDLADMDDRETGRRPLRDFLDDSPSPELLLSARIAERFGRGLPKIDPDDPHACATCFTSSYGKALMHSGSYLLHGDGLRRFSPDEVLRLHGFPAAFRWPPELGLRKRWHLAGNSVSVHALRKILAILPAFRPAFRNFTETV